MRRPDLLFLLISVVILLIVQLLLHNFLYFVVGSLICGTFAWRNRSFFRFFFIEILVLALCFAIKPIPLPTARIMGEILPVGTWGYIAAVVVTSALTFALCAYTVQLFIYPSKKI